ncbi:protein FAM131A-like isoform X1 [Oncorhynchus clarkii lewisi]|uniref:protein FAM131A-like isoform X1 n=2 Tax=Oncorhynchus clarkii lewisi TaxID=490388 RepID=UPI0039B99809
MWLTFRGGERGGRQREEVKFQEAEMIPKSRKSSDTRKAVSIQEIAALARSSLNGISQAMKDHVTKPTSLQGGRVAHLIEWKGWPKPTDSPTDPLHTHFNSYCHLTEGEQEARFAAGVAEQFAIAEAKLKAWASVDDDDVEEADKEFLQNNRNTLTLSTRSDTATSNHEPRVSFQAEIGSIKVPPSISSTIPVGSSSNSLHCDRPTSKNDPAPQQNDRPILESDRASPFPREGELVDGEDQPVPQLETGGGVCIVHKPDWRPRIRSSRFDSCYSTSHSESLGEEEAEEEDEEGSVFQEGREWHSCQSQRSFFSDRGSSGVASFDEEE